MAEDLFTKQSGGALGDVFTDVGWDYGRVYRPRMAAELTVPLAGKLADREAMNETEDTVALPLRVHSVTLTRNDINHADSAKLLVAFDDAPVDPRVLQSASGVLWIGQDDASITGEGTWQPRHADLQFAGVVTRIARKLTDEKGWDLELELSDYTTLFIESNHYPRAGYPSLSQTLSQAWAQVCDHTGPLDDEGNVLSTVAKLRDRIVFVGGAKDVVIGSALPKRYQAMGVTIFPLDDASSWTVWQQCVRAVGLVSYIHLDQCFVSTATDYYSADKPALFVLGRNVAALEETREIKFSGKGIGVLGFDPLTGTTIEGLYPPIGDKRVKRKRVGARVAATHSSSTKPRKAKAPPSPAALLASETRDVFNVPGLTDQKMADAVAQRIWEERSRQEIEGTFENYDLKVPHADGSWQRTLDLTSGDTIDLEIQPAIDACTKITDIKARINRLEELGFSEDLATLAAHNLVDLGSLGGTVYVKTLVATVTCADGADDGEVTFRITFQNRYDPNAPATGNTDSSGADRNWLELMKDPAAARKAVAKLSPGEAQSLLDDPSFITALSGKLRGNP